MLTNSRRYGAEIPPTLSIKEPVVIAACLIIVGNTSADTINIIADEAEMQNLPIIENVMASQFSSESNL